MIKVYWCAQTRAIRALWLMEELGVEYQLVPVDIRAGNCPPDFMVASPMGKVPAILDGDIGLAESAAIGLYLADKFPAAGLAPAFDDPARAHYLYWMIFTPSAMEPGMAERFGNVKPNKLAHGWGDYPTVIKTLERGLQRGPWLLGDRFSAADVLVGSTTNFMRVFGIEPDSEVIKAYTDRCLARPAFKRALERDAAGQ